MSTSTRQVATINVTKTRALKKKSKKSPRSYDLGPNPPKEEGGGDNLGMSGYEAFRAPDCVDLFCNPVQHPITEVY